MKVLIDKEDGNPPVAVEIGEVALRMVRASHNPSASRRSTKPRCSPLPWCNAPTTS